MKIIRLAIILIIFIVVGVALVRFQRKQQPASLSESHSKLQVTSSFYPLYYFASQIGGDKVNVIDITPAGAEPHDYELSTQDILMIQNSQVLLLNGSVEAWGDKVKQDLAGKPTMVIEVGDGLLNQQTVDEDGQPIVDPHIWLSPRLAKLMVDKTEIALAEADSTNQVYFLKNATDLKTQLDILDAQYRQGLATCQQKSIVTSHAAFGYLAADYGLTQVPITGISPDAEPSLQQLSKLADFARQNRVKYIFFENLVSPKLSQTLATEVGAQTLVLDPLEGISNDDMKQGKTYFTQMQQNLQNLRLALVCQ